MDSHLICHRCGATQGSSTAGEFYFVKIDAFADPDLPAMTAEDLRQDFSAQIEQLVEQMRDCSERELADQVHRRLTLHLCASCYSHWIENPTG